MVAYMYIYILLNKWRVLQVQAHPNLLEVITCPILQLLNKAYNKIFVPKSILSLFVKRYCRFGSILKGSLDSLKVDYVSPGLLSYNFFFP